MYSWPTTLFITAALVDVSLLSPQVVPPGVQAGETPPVATITVDIRPAASLVGFQGAAYSARKITKSNRALADGTSFMRTVPTVTLVYRDSSGRVRTEEPVYPAAKGPGTEGSVTLVEIQDPVSGYQYFLDPVSRVSHRVSVKTQRARATPGAFLIPASTLAMPDGTTYTEEPLGTDTMSGLTVVGERTTVTGPAGSRMCKDRPCSMVLERWTSDQLGLVILGKNTSPEGGGTVTFTTVLEEISTAEPDAALFQVPADYRIVDETGPFKIVIPRRN